MPPVKSNDGDHEFGLEAYSASSRCRSPRVRRSWTSNISTERLVKLAEILLSSRARRHAYLSVNLRLRYASVCFTDGRPGLIPCIREARATLARTNTGSYANEDEASSRPQEPGYSTNFRNPLQPTLSRVYLISSISPRHLMIDERCPLYSSRKGALETLDK